MILRAGFDIIICKGFSLNRVGLEQHKKLAGGIL